MQGEELKAMRTTACFSREQLEAELGLTVGYVGRMERGEKPIEKRTAIAARCVLEHRHWSEPVLVPTMKLGRQRAASSDD